MWLQKNKEESFRLLQTYEVFPNIEYVINQLRHDLISPLNAINGFSNMMVDCDQYKISSLRICEYAKYINQSGNKLLDNLKLIIDLVANKSNHITSQETLIEALRNALSKCFGDDKVMVNSQNKVVEKENNQELISILMHFFEFIDISFPSNKRLEIYDSPHSDDVFVSFFVNNKSENIFDECNLIIDKKNDVSFKSLRFLYIVKLINQCGFNIAYQIDSDLAMEKSKEAYITVLFFCKHGNNKEKNV